jgi:chromosome segregation ATPase
MDLPEYREAAQRLEAAQEQVMATEQEIAALEKQKKGLKGTVRALEAAEKVRVRLDTIQPERTLTGAVKGITVEQVEQLKAAALRGVQAEQRAKELTAENKRLQGMIPSTKEKLREAHRPRSGCRKQRPRRRSDRRTSSFRSRTNTFRSSWRKSAASRPGSWLASMRPWTSCGSICPNRSGH